jgi:hypothetical protein
MKIIDTFEKIINNITFSLIVSNYNDSFYYKINDCLVYDSIKDQYITNIKNQNTSIKINSSLTNNNDKVYIYLECTIASDFTISEASIIDSVNFLSFVDGTVNPDGFIQTKARALLYIIGAEGKICSTQSNSAIISTYLLNTLPATYLVIINGSPAVKIVPIRNLNY